MYINAKTLAFQLAHSLDAIDKNGKNGKIEASIWNNYVGDKGGKQIDNYISINNAAKSLAVYLCRQARNKQNLIQQLGLKWINEVEQNKSNSDAIKNKKVDTSYSKMNRNDALKRAEKDKRLEKLDRGDGWSISKDSFITDIPYAKKFTGKILSIVSSLINEHITVTSALGTAGIKGKKTPHKISQNYCTHHNAENPKLDIRTRGNANKLRKKLIATGFFCRVSVEPDHLDVQIKPEIYAAFEQGYKLENILAYARKNTLDKLIA